MSGYQTVVVFLTNGLIKIETNAEGGTRTRTPFRMEDFKSSASAIPPPRLIGEVGVEPVLNYAPPTSGVEI